MIISVHSDVFMINHKLFLRRGPTCPPREWRGGGFKGTGQRENQLEVSYYLVYTGKQTSYSLLNVHVHGNLKNKLDIDIFLYILLVLFWTISQGHYGRVEKWVEYYPLDCVWLLMPLNMSERLWLGILIIYSMRISCVLQINHKVFPIY